VSPPASNPPSRKSLPPFEALRAFDAVARLGGVRKAAQTLCRDHAAVSRHLRAIEAWTGTTLIERTAAGVVLTEDGVRYHKVIAQALDLIAQGTIDLMRRGSGHRLHIRCMPAFALHWLSSRLGEFEKQNPGIDFELQPATRGPDHASHEMDMDIRLVPTYGPQPELPAGFESMDLATVPIVAVASRAYLAQAPPTAKPADLLQHKLLHEENVNRWGNWLAAHGVFDDVYLAGPRLWQSHLTLDAARHGRGIALTNHLVVGDDIAAQRLVEVGAGVEAFQPYATGIYRLVARTERWDAPLVRRFRHWLVDTIAQELPRTARSPVASSRHR
jgi:LysR family glycine cleavage system transcriptional activator